MNIAQLLWKMWQLRITKSERFHTRQVMLGEKLYKICTRSALVQTTICAQDVVENDIRWEILEIVYSDQNPMGKSREAEMVRKGLYRPCQIGWLYISKLNERKLWLGKIVEGRPIPFVNGKYDPEHKHLNLSL